MKRSKVLQLFLVLSLKIPLLAKRSPHRPLDPQQPIISISTVGNPQVYNLSDSHLQEFPFFYIFDKKHFYDHLLPKDSIHYRYNNELHVTGDHLSRLIEHLLHEINNNCKEYTHFTVLKKRNFDKKHITGLLILKFKNYPFVLKLFIETPESFTQPFSKGFEPCCFFMMGGGINRHLSGFTRIKNLEKLQAHIQESPLWREKVDFPRKWFWLPQHSSWLSITSHNIGKHRTNHTTIPAVYAIICDEIAIERTFTLQNTHDKETALALINYLHQEVDPHINNYVIEKKTGKVVPIDSEHFPSMVGIHRPTFCGSYEQWYLELSAKMIRNTFGRTKEERRLAQYKAYMPF